MEPVTAQALLGQFWALSGEDRREFLRLLGTSSTAEIPLFIANGLTVPELFRLNQLLVGPIVSGILPIAIRQACRLARETPHVSDADFEAMVTARATEEVEGMGRAIAEVERAQLKEARDRQSDPETIRRNVDICDLRRQDPKKWTLGKLAQRFKINRSTVRDVIKDEAKWRQLNR